jgi:hypothetical protein
MMHNIDSFTMMFVVTIAFIIDSSSINFFRPEHHWSDLRNRNAHLVHQNWYPISFTFQTLGRCLCWWTFSPRGALQPSSEVLRYLVKIRLTCQEKSKCKFISERRIISLMHSSILRWIWLNFMALWFLTALLVFGFQSFSARVSLKRLKDVRDRDHVIVVIR